MNKYSYKFNLKILRRKFVNKKVFIVGAKRSPIGAFLGTLKDVHPAEIETQVLTRLLEETKLPKSEKKNLKKKFSQNLSLVFH